jgi:SNF2 family DNA or RNA helicase
VEDQAAGRAHRIGQERPVTVYRLVVKGSVEEPIMALHRDKRALAEGLFAGEEFGAAASVEELLELMREG